MHILVTNDDGINAPGIKALWQGLKTFAEVTVIAPDGERSAMSQAITLHKPICVSEYYYEDEQPIGWAVEGTPTDCVKIALESLMKKKPDIIVSGINNGPNLGTDVLYSGTVSAAIEGAMANIPSVAVSLNNHNPKSFSCAVKFTCSLIKQLSQKSLPENTLLNVNIPDIDYSRINGVHIAKLGTRKYDNMFEHRKDPRGRSYFWMNGKIADIYNEDETDTSVLKKGGIAITPIHFDLTNYNSISVVKGWDIKL